MARLRFSISILLFLVSFLREAKGGDEKNGIYIVYMGAALRSDHAHLLSSLHTRNAVVHSYKHGFSGFAARLTKEEAHSLAHKPGVVSVFPDPLLQLHTTRSWDFLEYQNSIVIDGSAPPSDTKSTTPQGSDTIIGILDTGVWPESESFNDKGMGSIPPRWKGTCMTGQDFTSSNCNRKLIGARYYPDQQNSTARSLSPRDTVGHGTHVSSTAAGTAVSNASYYGLAAGTAKGGSPASRIAMYTVCTTLGCRGSAILAAFDDAIADGVDVLSLSLGAPSIFEPDFSVDPVAIGAFHAVEKGITVVCSAGNDGPDAKTVVNVAPWILTVGATTIDRDFESDVVLGGNIVIKGESINFSNLKRTPVYPLMYGKSAKLPDVDQVYAANCDEGYVNGSQFKGKIVVCENSDNDSDKRKVQLVKKYGGIGLIIVHDMRRAVASNYASFPTTIISSKDAPQILNYINSTSDPVATILPTVVVEKYTPAPAVAYFSARGPTDRTRNLLKPDIVAPGANILAAWMGNDTQQALAGEAPPMFNLVSGTSMACPHVSAVVATIKSQNPTWSPSAIKSAIMTTATQMNNLKSPITTDSGSVATPYDFGAGLVSTTGSFQPGLVYEASTIDYLNFLCNYGYNLSTIKLISSAVPDGFACLKPKPVLLSNLNYPSIAISKFFGNKSRTIQRTVTNVAGDDQRVYTVSIKKPSGLIVTVTPTKLQFTKNNQQLTYEVLFSTSMELFPEDVFGSITWANGKYRVQIPFAVSSKGNYD